jgi:hypothetical protein
MAETTLRNVTIAKRRFELSRSQVEHAVDGVLPEPIASHYVVVGSRRYPPKQVVGLVTGTDRADFTSHQARRILMGLGFAVGRRRPPSPDPTRSSSPAPSRQQELAEELRAFRGRWVAVKDDELLVAASSPHEVVAWLSRHGLRADSMFRVPESQRALSGLAPL